MWARQTLDDFRQVVISIFKAVPPCKTTDQFNTVVREHTCQDSVEVPARPPADRNPARCICLPPDLDCLGVSWLCYTPLPPLTRGVPVATAAPGRDAVPSAHPQRHRQGGVAAQPDQHGSDAHGASPHVKKERGQHPPPPATGVRVARGSSVVSSRSPCALRSPPPRARFAASQAAWERTHTDHVRFCRYHFPLPI